MRRDRRHLLRTQEPTPPSIDNGYDDIAAPPSVINTAVNIAPVVLPAPPSTPVPVQTRNGRVVKLTVHSSLYNIRLYSIAVIRKFVVNTLLREMS